MKNLLLSLLFVAAVFGNRAVFSQEESTAGEGKSPRERKFEAIRRPTAIDANEARRLDETTRERQMERDKGEREKLRKDMMKLRETRIKEAMTRKGTAIKELPGELGAGMDPQQRAAALQAKLVEEESKHLNRVARLTRIKQLADEQNSADTAMRAENLLRKEQFRYMHKRDQMEQHINRMLRGREGKSDVKLPAGQGKETVAPKRRPVPVRPRDIAGTDANKPAEP